MKSSIVNTPSVRAIAAKMEKIRRRAERRVSHRVPCRVRCSDTHIGKGLCAVGQTINLSANGIAVQLAEPMEEGTPVEILLPQLDGEPTRVCGKVAHTRRVHTGSFEVGIWIEPDSQEF